MRLLPSLVVKLAVAEVADVVVTGAAAELFAAACGADSAGLPDGLGCDNALAF